MGGALTAVAGVVWKIVRFLGEFLGKLIYYFGLYVPLAYLIYGLVLYFVFGFKGFNATTDGKLFIMGFCLSLICSAILTAKNLVVRPYEKYFKRADVIEYGKEQHLKKDMPEAPKIYKSRVNPGVIVYEYSNRYDLYEEFEDGMRQVATEFKSKKDRRW